MSDLLTKAGQELFQFFFLGHGFSELCFGTLHNIGWCIADELFVLQLAFTSCDGLLQFL
jgi:hypothetical protein